MEGMEGMTELTPLHSYMVRIGVQIFPKTKLTLCSQPLPGGMETHREVIPFLLDFLVDLK